MVAAPPAQDEETGVQYRGLIIIEWPPPLGGGPHGALLGNLLNITDAMTGKLITSCSQADVTIRAAVNHLVTADLTLCADEDGEPIFDLMRIPEDGAPTGVFPFLVAEMRVRSA